MALVHNNVTVGTTITSLCKMPRGIPYTAVIVNNNDNATIFIGDSAITATAGSNQGLPITKGTNQQIWLHAGDELYAISTAGTLTGAITVLYSGI